MIIDGVYMQKGVMFNGRDIVRLSIPVMIDQLSGILAGVVDTIMVSNCGEAVVSGVNIVDMLCYLFTVIFTAVAAGGAVVVAQYIGNSDSANATSASSQTIILSAVVSVVLTIPGVIFPKSVLCFIYGEIDAQVLTHAVDYFYYISISNVFLGIYFACASILRSIGNTKPVMFMGCFINVINCIGNAVLIYGYDMGASGAAIATSFSRIVGAIAMLFYILFLEKGMIFLNIRNIASFNKEMMLRVLRIATPTGIENTLFQIGGLITRRFIVMMPNSTVHLAATTVATSTFNLMNLVGATTSLSIMTVIGQCIGADCKQEAKRHYKSITIVTSVLEAVVCGVTFIFMDSIIGMYGIGDESSGMAWKMLLVSCVFIPLFWPAAFVAPAGLRAAGDIRFTMVSSMAVMWLVRIGLGYYLGIVMGLGALGVWAAMSLDWIVRTVIYIFRYRSGRWLEKKVI